MGVQYTAGDMIPNGVIPPQFEESLKVRNKIVYLEPEQMAAAPVTTVVAAPTPESVAPTPKDEVVRKRGRPKGSKNKKKAKQK
jgi:hypothetical protein